jgi:hypothetical protein
MEVSGMTHIWVGDGIAFCMLSRTAAICESSGFMTKIDETVNWYYEKINTNSSSSHVPGRGGNTVSMPLRKSGIPVDVDTVASKQRIKVEMNFNKIIKLILMNNSIDIFYLHTQQNDCLSMLGVWKLSFRSERQSCWSRSLTRIELFEHLSLLSWAIWTAPLKRAELFKDYPSVVFSNF